MLLKCYTQYASKYGKLSSGHRTGKGQFSFQSQRKAMPKNAQTTAQLYPSHMLVIPLWVDVGDHSLNMDGIPSNYVLPMKVHSRTGFD